MHHAAAEGASQNLLVTGLRPQIIHHNVIELDSIGLGLEQITDHFDAEVAAAG